jgi:hypothetical protein
MTKLSRSLALAATPIALVVTLWLSTGPTLVSASNGRSGRLNILKDCSNYTRLAGGFCTISSSNFPEIPPGSKVYYTQAFGILQPAWLDSTVVLDTGNGNKAVGRCTVDFGMTVPGVCTFSDGTGALAGFTARVDVSPGPVPGQPNMALFSWIGTYKFDE